ncbi:MAG: TIGR01212 family radical SAM protein [Muribaculaceae bacterium]|nr:TIGR01212 family radical SAM protein [Muribaculaceae bacterium]
MNVYYKDYAEYLAEIFPGTKVQKISVNAGFGCPNRDGTIGTGGCIYCNNASFSPSYCLEEANNGISAQLEKGKGFFGRKYPQMKYLAYFQSFTNTYTGKRLHSENVDNITSLRELYLEALGVEDVVGLVIGTRPDTFDEKIAKMLGEINEKSPVFVEFGVESSSDATLKLINRGHTFQQTRDAVALAASVGLHAGVHVIAGLPGEGDEGILKTVRECCELPIESIKIHHLQVIRDTTLSRLWHAGEMSPKIFEVDEYIKLCSKLVDIIPSRIAIERFLASAPPAMVEAPKWGLKNYEFVNKLHAYLKKSIR